VVGDGRAFGRWGRGSDVDGGVGSMGGAVRIETGPRQVVTAQSGACARMVIVLTEWDEGSMRPTMES